MTTPAQLEPQSHGPYRVGDRVRVRIGPHAGTVGTVSYCPVSVWTKYGVKLDTEPRPIGYKEGELEAA